MKRYSMDVSPLTHFFCASTKSSGLWLLLRIYLGWIWVSAGWEKLNNPAWVGDHAGAALSGFIQGALSKTGGAHPEVQGWYADFLQQTVLPHVVSWSYFVTAGELLVGLALIFGFLTALTALIAMFMNLNFMLAGTDSLNPIMFTLSIGLVAAWRVSGFWGLDRFVLPLFRRALRGQGGV